jgi:formyl-CoA transferase
LEAALTSDQAKHRNVIADVDQPGIGSIKLLNMSAKFSKTPGCIESPPPELSEHTKTILSELGYTLEQQNMLKEEMVI